MRSFFKVVGLLILLLNTANAKDNSSGNKWNFYTGMFDFSDDGKKSNLFGVEHINENLYRESFLGTLQPVTGAFITADNAGYIYTGFQIPYEPGALKITPSFAPGLYSEGDGKDLGHVIEFKSEIQISINLTSNSEIGISYNHLSNASLGSKNPGANSYIINFIKKY
tara:strand:+ start:399 stop:899 length:501 start_codon:yes stop_codon:yes gene_type:complete